MRNSRTKKFSQLRWKLMSSYVAITVGAIVLVLFIAAVAGYLWLDNQLNNTDILFELIEDVASDFSDELRPMLNQSPYDFASINHLIERLESDPIPILILDAPMAFQPGDIQVLVTDNEGFLLGSTSNPIFPIETPGNLLNTDEFPELSELVKELLKGNPSFPGWMRSTISGDIVAIGPIFDLAESEVLGVLIASFTPPTVISLMVAFASTIVIDIFVLLVLTVLIGSIFGNLISRTITTRLVHLSEAATTWSLGDFSVFVEDQSNDELGQLALILNKMAQQLQVLFDTQSQLLVLEERNRLARDLHDSAKQQAFAAAAQISAARNQLQNGKGNAVTNIMEAEKIVGNLQQELTNLITELRPSEIENQGLGAALRAFAEDWSRQNQIEIHVSIENERLVPLVIEQTIYRVFQEALSNVSRHSQAKSVNMQAVYTKNRITCLLKDDGIGFSADVEQGGFGIHSMKDRVKAIGSSLSIQSQPGKGTAVSFVINLKSGQNE